MGITLKKTKKIIINKNISGLSMDKIENKIELPPSCLSKEGCIINQSKLYKIPYGNYTSDQNGCGWIAIYNVMKLLEMPEEPEIIIEYFEKYILFQGKFGTNPMAIENFLKSRKIKYKHTFFENKFDAYEKECKVGIILYWADKYVHYVAFSRVGDKNHYFNDIYGKENDIRSREDFYRINQVKIAYLITIAQDR